MKKKVLFMVINMNVGGTEKALLNMIDVMPEDKYDITILMLEKFGGFLNAIPSRVNVECLDGYREIKEILNNPPKTVITNLLKSWNLVKAIHLMLLFFIATINKERSFIFKSLLNDKGISQKEYDVAIAYAGPMDFISFFIAEKIKAKKKIQWIHFDITKIGFNPNFARRIYKKFDKIIVVSEEARKKLINIVPEVKEKSEVFNNIISPKLIRNQAKSGRGFNDNFEGLRILTVGRLSPEKGHDLAIRVTKKLIDIGHNIKWYCVGEGNERIKYEEMIEAYNLKESFVLMGSDSNPYPYIQECDIYVQPSRYEGYCISILEAKCLNKPIITTDVNGAREQIKNEETGFIVNFDENELFYSISRLIEDENLRKALSERLKASQYCSNEKNKIYSIIVQN